MALGRTGARRKRRIIYVGGLRGRKAVRQVGQVGQAVSVSSSSTIKRGGRGRGSTGLMKSSQPRSSAVEAARKRKRGPTLSEQRAEQAAAEAAAEADLAARKQQKTARLPTKQQPTKKQLKKKKQPSNTQPSAKKTSAKKPKTKPQPNKGVTVSVSFHFEKMFDEELEVAFQAGEEVPSYVEDVPGQEAHLDSGDIQKSEWGKPLTALPAEQYTFTLRAPRDWRDGVAHDDESLCCSMHLSRTREDGKVQFYAEDNDMASDLTFEELMRSRPGNKRTWPMTWGGFGPGWFELEARLLPGNRQAQVRIVRAGLSCWPGDDDDEDDGYSRWEKPLDFGEEDDDEFDDYDEE